MIGWQERSVVCTGARETRELGRRLGRAARPGDVVALSGPLGAGKTCLVQGFAEGTGVPAAVVVASPTFAIVHELPGRLTLYHMDFYRLEAAEIEELGLEEQLDGTGVSIAEWAERWPAYVERSGLNIRIAGRGEMRTLWIASGERRFLEAIGGGDAEC